MTISDEIWIGASTYAEVIAQWRMNGFDVVDFGESDFTDGKKRRYVCLMLPDNPPDFDGREAMREFVAILRAQDKATREERIILDARRDELAVRTRAAHGRTKTPHTDSLIK